MHRHQAYTNGFSARKKDDDVYVSSERSDLDSRFVYNIHDLEDEKADVPYAHSARWNARSNAHRARQRLKIILVSGGLVFLWCIWHFTGSHFSRPSRPPPLEIETVRYYDLEDVQGSSAGWEREERVLLCTPLRDAETHLHMFFSHLRNFTYPHNLIDLGFLVSDSKDKTQEVLINLLEELQADPDPKMPYGEISIIRKDFGQQVNQDVESRHGFAAQASRRKLMAQARNWLLSASLRPYHSWVYWRDADVETAPFTILEDLMRHNKDVIVPNVWRPLPDWLGGEQPYDLNSWQESDTALALADTLDEDAVIVEGYAEYATWRPHLAYLRDPYGDPDMEMEIDGVGGVSILAKARVFRAGVHFPAFSFEKHAETEGFGKMARKMDFSVVGLPHYTVWHLYEPSVDDIRHMEEMEQERKEREQEEKERADRAKKIKEEFKDTGSQWEKDKADMAEKIKQEEKEQEAKAGGPANAQAPKEPADGKSDSEKKGSDKAEPKKDTKADAKDDKTNVKGGAGTEKKAGPKDEKKPEAKPESKGDAKSDTKSETKPQGKPESKPDGKPESKAEKKPDSKPNGKGESDSKAKSNSKSDEKPAAKGDAATDTKSDTKSNPKPESRFKNKPANSDKDVEKPLGETESKSGKDGESKVESKGEKDSTPDSKSDRKLEKKKPEVEAEKESKPEAESKPKAKEA